MVATLFRLLPPSSLAFFFFEATKFPLKRREPCVFFPKQLSFKMWGAIFFCFQRSYLIKCGGQCSFFFRTKQWSFERWENNLFFFYWTIFFWNVGGNVFSFHSSYLFKSGGQCFFFSNQTVIFWKMWKQSFFFFLFSNKQFSFEMWGAMFFLFTAVIFWSVGDNVLLILVISWSVGETTFFSIKQLFWNGDGAQSFFFSQ